MNVQTSNIHCEQYLLGVIKMKSFEIREPCDKIVENCSELESDAMEIINVVRFKGVMTSTPGWENT